MARKSTDEINQIAKVKQEPRMYEDPESDPTIPSIKLQRVKYEAGYFQDETSPDLIFVDNLNEESELDIDENIGQQKEHSDEIDFCNKDLNHVLVSRISGQGRKLPIQNRHSSDLLRPKRLVRGRWCESHPQELVLDLKCVKK